MSIKRVMVSISILLLITGMVFGAGSREAQPRTVELEYFSLKPEAVPVMDVLIEKFEKENPGIKVTQTATPEPGTVLRTRIATGEVPDITNTFPAENMYKNLFKDGFFLDLTNEPFLSNIPESTIDIIRYEGKVYALPMTLSVYGIYYRKDIFARYGLSAPTTYEELMNAARVLKANGVTPFSFANKDIGNIAQRTERLLGVINNTIDEEFRQIARGEMRVQNSPSLNAFAKMMLETYEYGQADSLAIDYETSVADVVNGRAAMTISGTWALGTMRTHNPNIDEIVELIPFPNPIGKTNVPINVDTSFSVSSDTRHKAEALKFVEFMSRTENAQIYADMEKSPNIVKGVQYNVVPHARMLDYLAAGDIYVTAINFWPTGLREEIRTPVQLLLMNGNVDAFLTSVGNAINRYYNN
jgi:raffinose/stachyose/melibiose transport system substrate-binding protein